MGHLGVRALVWRSWCVAIVATVSLSDAEAQQKRFGFLPVPMVEGAEYVFDTASQHRVRVVVVASGFYRPFSVALLPSGDALVSERNTALRLVHDVGGPKRTATRLDPVPVAGIEPQRPRTYGGAGIQDVVLHPDFARNRLVYFTYVTPGPNDGAGDIAGRGTAIMRGVFTGRSLENVEEIYRGAPGGAYGPRLAFARDGSMFMTTAVIWDDKESQRPDTINGKIVRLMPDGTVPVDNPFVGRKGFLPELYAIGIRDAQGLAFSADGKELLSIEHGPNGGDELNLIRAGRNYGWPIASFGRHYDGRRVSESPVAAGIEPPIVVWLPSIAPSGLTRYGGAKFPGWNGNLFTGSAQRGNVPGSGGLERIIVNEKLEEIGRETMLTELHLRIRDVREGPDGLLYLLSDQDDGALLRLEPAGE
jgi:aldose sugar dehydrogenase